MPCLSCAGAYVFGAAGSNECPAGSRRIEAEAACRTAAAAASKTVGWSFVETSSSSPRGCYYAPGMLGILNYAYFNTHPVGAGSAGTQLLCGTGVPPPRRARGQRRCVCALT